jgi:structural maintenance of chromosome 3 (chondroitin sulfate proteoglycan 6)
LIIVSGDQVGKKGAMTGGFYDSRRSKLKFVKIVRDNQTAIEKKKTHLEAVRNKLTDILF